MTSRVGAKGQVVIPKRVRDALGIRPGDEVVVEEQDGEARVRRLSGVSAWGMLAGEGDMLADLEAEHHAELAADKLREDRRR